MTKYPVSKQLRSAIEALFDDPSVGLGLLGRGLDFLPTSDKVPSLNPNMSATDRARLFREKLEDYVAQMASEAKELGEEELPRLRSETTATLVVLRELQSHFPEAFAD